MNVNVADIYFLSIKLIFLVENILCVTILGDDEFTQSVEWTSDLQKVLLFLLYATKNCQLTPTKLIPTVHYV